MFVRSLCTVLCGTVARLCIFSAVTGSLTVSTTAAAGDPHYHVSYLWHHDLKSVENYRRDVGVVLGRDVTRNLKVVANGRLFGLVYMRRGGSAGALKAARTHTRVLRRSGLEPAAVIREGHWRFLNDRASAPRGRVQTPRRHAPSGGTRNHAMHNLEAAVSNYIARLRAQGAITRDERTGWAVYDFTSGEKLVTINEDIQFQAASLIKPFIALAFFHRIKNGDFFYGPKSRRHLRRMIHWSNNDSTNWIMRQVGGPHAVQRVLRVHYPTIFKDTKIVEYIPAGGRTYRNKASVHDYSRFLHALWTKKIPGAREIRRFMALPGSDRIFTGASDIPIGTGVYNKTGSTARLCGDMGILNVKSPDGRTYPYIIVGLIEKRHRARNYAKWIRDRSNIIRNVSNIVYKGISLHHNFAKQL